MLDCLYHRQSIRKYLSKPIEDGKVECLLKAAMQAPTARNMQSWQFIVITNRELLDSMIEIQPYTGMMKQAPCAILVIGNREATMEEGYLYLDGAAAIENMLIEAVHQGLGTCWCGIYPKQDRIQAFKKTFKLADNLIPIGVVAVGYGDEIKPIQERYDASKVTYIK